MDGTRHRDVHRLYDVLDAAAQEAPEAPALSVDGTTWTFQELRARTDALSAHLSGRCSPGARVALLAHNRLEYVAAYYGVPRDGRILVPLNQRLHPREWADQVVRSGAELVVGEPDLLERLEREGGLPAGHPPLVDVADLPWDGPAPSREDDRDPAEVAWLMFTSGTTGRPKGVRLTHRSLLAGVAVTASGRPVLPDDVFCTPFPLCHVAGYQVILHHLFRRHAVVLRRFDPAVLVDAARRHGVTNLSLAPTMLEDLLAHLDGDPAALGALRATVRVVAYGSAPMPVPLLRRADAVLGCDLNQGYGMTELSGNATFLSPADHRAAVAARPELAASAGRPGDGAEIAVVGEDGAPLPPGEQGEVVVRGAQVADGYWDDPEATAEAFAGGWFRTGDAGRVDGDGRLYLADRIKDVIITGGENVSSREVEDVLRTVPGVGEVAVVGLPDPRWGQSVCAVIVPDGVPPREEDLVAACRARLAGFKAPRRVEFVAALPRTGTGKVRKAALRAELTGRPS
ncbi:acyl-CoA synthetase (AMP-forming)/AMP-acid ligase II [Actinomadura coerulea]|uniref:Acyl-CoA synthetase (AMP-forming)/AMP-acid ligase II n=1 Tax=Actinomadura coerulea TaxID=46159 RepID=A0A7X0G1Y0_9ACTN|nr:AMP-binding protein [Actinomadura coerulea]MBB6397929.1 acyl-CoA synthetase (AMP-forming)/AMP-acid ligase II [Actinomadura coerulea]GGQ33415.1 AMP-dependent synthetase [Actinomadura coerulea]